MRFKNYNNSKKKNPVFLGPLDRAATATLKISVVRQIGYTCGAPEMFLSYLVHTIERL